jgi:hypothetical protein
MAQKHKTRVPAVKNRDPRVTQQRTTKSKPKEEQPKPALRSPRRYIPASVPTVCPDCGHSTRMDDGRHVDPVRKTILEYRSCSKCPAKLAAGRPMTKREEETLCGRAEAVSEYETLAQ